MVGSPRTRFEVPPDRWQGGSPLGDLQSTDADPRQRTGNIEAITNSASPLLALFIEYSPRKPQLKMRLSIGLLLWATCTMSATSASAGGKDKIKVFVEDCDWDADFTFECGEPIDDLPCEGLAVMGQPDHVDSPCGEAGWRYIAAFYLHSNEERIMTIYKAGSEPNRVR